METITWAFIGTIIGTVVGASVSIVTTMITGSNARKLQERAVLFERTERAREFQRGNLLELQNKLSKSMRLIIRAHLTDVKEFMQKGMIGKIPLLPEDLDHEISSLNRQLLILTERISDDVLRESVNDLRQNMTSVLFAKVENDSKTAMIIANESFEKTMLQLGQVLRDSY